MLNRNGGPTVPCEDCEGRGGGERQDERGQFVPSECVTCNGSGRVKAPECDVCGSTPVVDVVDCLKLCGACRECAHDAPPLDTEARVAIESLILGIGS